MAVWVLVIAVTSAISCVTSEGDILIPKVLSPQIGRLEKYINVTPDERNRELFAKRSKDVSELEEIKVEENLAKEIYERQSVPIPKRKNEEIVYKEGQIIGEFITGTFKEVPSTTEILEKLHNINIKYVTLPNEPGVNNEAILERMEGLFPVKYQALSNQKGIPSQDLEIQPNFLQNLIKKQNTRPLESLDELFPEKLTRNLTIFTENLKNTTEHIHQSEKELSPEQLARKLDMSTEYFLVPEKTTQRTSTTNKVTEKPTPTKEPEIERHVSLFREEVWVVPVVTLAAVSMFLMVGFEVFVLCKAWRTTPSRIHLFLGQMLLLGLFACASLGGVLALAPSPSTCAAVRFGVGLAYAVVFASLLVKCVFLISLNGGVYLPAPYQGLLLLFAVLIQVAIGAQWLLTDPPQIDILHESHTTDVQLTRNKNPTVLVTRRTGSTSVTLCRTPYMDMLFSLCYVLFLIVFVAVLAVKSRGIRDNYREATYIGLSVGCTIPIWLVWTLSGMLVADRHRDACLAFGLVITAAVVFLVMFMPKGRQLAAMGKDGVFLEDREDRFSSLSRTGSGYSPSFFHFKPAGKYGSKHHQVGPTATVTTLGPGMFLLLFLIIKLYYTILYVSV